jgi:hypothetical protein
MSGHREMERSASCQFRYGNPEILPAATTPNAVNFYQIFHQPPSHRCMKGAGQIELLVFNELENRDGGI